MKITEGNDFYDSTFSNFLKQCQNSNRKWGFYHFAQGYDPESEARWFVHNANSLFGKGIPVLDFEITPFDYECSTWCEDFVREVHELTGYWCVLYTYASKLAEFDETWLPSKCPLWIAGYPTPRRNFDKIYPPYNVSPWSYAFMWQFTFSLELEEWNGNLDGDIAYINEQDWKNYYGGDDMPTANEIAETVWGYNYKDTVPGGQNVYDQAAATYLLAKRAADAAEEALKLIKEMKEGK